MKAYWISKRSSEMTAKFLLKIQMGKALMGEAFSYYNVQVLLST